MSVVRTGAVVRIASGFLVLICSLAGDAWNALAEEAAQPVTRIVPSDMPERITNQFGMTFCLVRVDPSRADHKESYPKASFYFQETELTGEQVDAFYTAVDRDAPSKASQLEYELGIPTEWRQVLRYGQALSEFDTQYDYRLPSQQEWVFACKNGYDQACPVDDEDARTSTRQNKYGIDGFMNSDAECVDAEGMFVGMGDFRARSRDGKETEDCGCDEFVIGNPDGDDGLNEVIIGRYVLVVESASNAGASVE